MEKNNLEKTIEEENIARQEGASPTTINDMEEHRRIIQSTYQSPKDTFYRIIAATVGNPVTYLIGATVLYNWLKG